MNVVFFGSTSDSVLVLEKLPSPVAVVTQTPRPVGRKQIMTPTPVETWAKKHNIPVLTFPNNPDHPYLFADEGQVADSVDPLRAELLVTASFGQKIPTYTISQTKFGGLNVHPSLLPRWRGADPVPWAIVTGDHQTGVTILTLTEKFDEGKIIAQQKYPITDKDTTVSLRTKLFEKGAELLVTSLPDYISGKNKGIPQKVAGEPYAKRLTREDGYEPWKNIVNPEESERISRKFRAFHPWPGLWTKIMIDNEPKRLKILSWPPDLVQLEGKKPVSFKQFQKAYFPS